MQELANSLPPSCTSKMNSNLVFIHPKILFYCLIYFRTLTIELYLIFQCLFPEYYVEDIQTPVFLIESAFDQEEVRPFSFEHKTFKKEKNKNKSSDSNLSHQ